MLYYDRTDVCEGIDVNKASASKECIIYRYWYFLDNECKFQPDTCNGCHDLLMISMNLDGIGILSIRGADYRWYNNGISKSEAVNFPQNADLNKKVKHLKKN